MMFKKVKFGKIAIVIFLTLLIWVWADLALDETPPEKPAVVVVDESVDPKLWISFDKSASADIKITLSGPHTAVTTLDRELRKGLKPLEFVFNAVQEKMDKPGEYSLKLLEFLQKDRELRRRGLKIQSCDPNELSVNVVQLEKKSLTVECFDESGNPLKAQSIEPSKVDAWVPVDSRLTAKVKLTKAEIDKARINPVSRKPYIEFSGSQRREIATELKVTMPPQEDILKDYTVTEAKLGIALSVNLNLQGKYKVEVTNLSEVISPVAIKATPAAKQAYESMRYQVILEIDDEDTKSEETRREVVYNFPEEFVRKNEIILNQSPAQARFKLKPISPSTENP